MRYWRGVWWSGREYISVRHSRMACNSAVNIEVRVFISEGMHVVVYRICISGRLVTFRVLGQAES